MNVRNVGVGNVGVCMMCVVNNEKCERGSESGEPGEGILGPKEGRGIWLWSPVTLAVLSSRISTVRYSLTGRHDNVPVTL